MIRVGQHKLQDLDLKWWRSQIGLVEQEPYLFDETIFENVSNGLIGTEWQDVDPEKKLELVEAACKESFADEFISRLPEVCLRHRDDTSESELTILKGYNTRVGDAGIRLSGGQRQRLAIARAIIRNPKILILDEATSSIDNRGERVVQAALDKVAKDRTTIMIAHRLSTVKKADNIIVLAKGKVVQWGSHQSLMASVGGPYWLLVNSQHLGMDEADQQDEPGVLAKPEARTVDLMTLDETHGEMRGSGGTKEDGADYQSKGLFRSFGTLLLDQRSNWPRYSTMILGALITGGNVTPLT